ncbi:MAG: lysophospholipid acyltransferase family protein [Deltaproteobacteria bacterium]|nr:lysophospholipid acyltransferase family protein [Deltaproteobacteria bacterium]MBW2016343.1 lysophospholipid acyltransferase family protein [Deltaproteobacteria bacterium]MBW2129609.1 lysophospholipid acyltransferase family protein [Deltaproteobacteria bacterium]MBW2304006.1 lysophospholipid acyltransferase family protein [Deltaproteobacteria bacterium]
MEKTQFRWYDGALLRVVPPLAALLIKSWMLTCRVVETRGREKAEEALERAGGRAVFGTWHQRMSYHFHHLGARGITVMISQSRDGEYAARVATWLGFKNVRGSSTRGGSKALRDLIERLKEGAIGGMLADGPQGPPRVAKIGSVLMARNAGVPLIPVLWGADRCWVLNSWDRFLVPKPFARIALYYGDPIWVPPEADGEVLEVYRRRFEDLLNQGARWCDEQFGAERPWRKAGKKGLPEIGPLPPPS